MHFHSAASRCAVYCKYGSKFCIAFWASTAVQIFKCFYSKLWHKIGSRVEISECHCCRFDPQHSVKAGIMLKSLISKVKIDPKNYQKKFKLVQSQQRKFSDVVDLLDSDISNMILNNSVES